MKKYLAMVLIITVLLGICGCTENVAMPEQSAPAEGLLVGYAREKIMPETEVPMCSATTNPISGGFRDYLYATCIALTYGQETVLLITQDLLNTNTAKVAKSAITEATGIPAERIMLCSTHTHSCPRMNISDDSIVAYTRDVYAPAMAAAAKAALSDRAPATLSGTKNKTEGMNFVRHYKMSDGTYAGDNFGSFSNSQIVSYATVNDPEMLLVKICREGDKRDILIMNWQAHPCLTKADNILSADFIGSTREAIEEQTDMLFAYFTGDAGNQNVTSMISADVHHMENDAFGKALAQYAIDALKNMQPLEGTGIRVSQEQLEYATNKANTDKLDQAKEVVALWEAGGTTEANALAAKYGISSWMEARYIIQRVNYPETAQMELYAINVAGMAFVTAPYEMFTDNGIYIKENSPFDMTMVFSCANNSHGYCPTEEAFDYESYEASSSYFARGIGEAAASKLVEMLSSLK